MRNSASHNAAMAPDLFTSAFKTGVPFFRAMVFALAVLGIAALGLPCYGAETAAQKESSSPGQKNAVPQWSWDWVEDLRETGQAIIPVPVTVNPQSNYRFNPKAGAAYRLSMGGTENSDRRSLFSMLDDGEALLSLLDRSGRENAPGFEGMLSDTLNSSFLSMGSRLEFHVSKRFLPYLGGGIIYGGRDSASHVSANLPKASGYELGVGFTFSDAAVRFGLDFLYRGMDLNAEDPCMTMRKDESCPNNFDKDGYSMSLGFTVHF